MTVYMRNIYTTATVNFITYTQPLYWYWHATDPKLVCEKWHFMLLARNWVATDDLGWNGSDNLFQIYLSVFFYGYHLILYRFQIRPKIFGISRFIIFFLISVFKFISFTCHHSNCIFIWNAYFCFPLHFKCVPYSTWFFFFLSFITNRWWCLPLIPFNVFESIKHFICSIKNKSIYVP